MSVAEERKRESERKEGRWRPQQKIVKWVSVAEERERESAREREIEIEKERERESERKRERWG